jgi:hypothetical protein
MCRCADNFLKAIALYGKAIAMDAAHGGAHDNKRIVLY